ncbi:hypothetical protein Marpi_1229 [Marinitoga piezophila KA3]|uniref:Glycosyltransferase n=1 Tax=Marinitoga piezophila (strain DSM 14283 / JCM 11233 / KA3) TaxID=443254 RepID=H2J8E9_MARPK|nr:glycosyltransferase family 4 protein [Marinitoga piezophila]AEX85633.1 hypothetical protein Marpi_1229 [Marinitoga piezophila KA3]
MKKKLLYITREFNPTKKDGLSIRFSNTLDALTKEYEVHLLYIGNKENEYIMKESFDIKKISVFNLKKQKKIFSFLKTLTFGANYYKNLYGGKFNDYVINYILENDIDIVYVNYFYLTSFFTDKRLIHIKKIVDLIDAISLHMKEAKDVSFFRKLFYKLQRDSVLKSELEAVKISDLAFITTETEKKYLLEKNNNIKSGKIKILWNGVDKEIFDIGEAKIKNIKTKENHYKKKIAFLGSMDYYPNQIAVRRLIKNIFPKITDKIKNIELIILGKNPPQDIINMCKENHNISLLGYVEDLSEVLLNIDVLILPMTIASGIQNKFLTGLASATPTIITKRALFTNKLKPKIHVITAESDEDYIEEILNIYINKQNIKNISLNAYTFAKEYLDWNSVKKRFIQQINEVSEG